MGIFKYYRSVVSFMITGSLAFSPLAQAKETHPQQVPNQIYNLLNYTNSSSKQTVGQWFAKGKAFLHPTLADQLAPWVASHANEPMPKIEAIPNSKNGGGVRLIVKDQGKLIPLDLYTQDGESYLEMGGKRYTYEDFYYSDVFAQTFPKPILKTLSFEEYKSLYNSNPKLAVNYISRLRGVMTALETYPETFFPSKFQANQGKKTSYLDMILETAYAISSGAACIVGGHISKTGGKRISCGYGDSAVTQGCGRNQISCHPVIYGYSSSGGNNCVANKDPKQVSIDCSNFYPLPASGDDMIKSYLQKAGKDPKSTQDQAHFYSALQSQISEASGVCFGDPLRVTADFAAASAKGEQQRYTASNFTEAFPNQKDEHHRIACATMLNRLFKAKESADCVNQKVAAANGDAKPATPAENKKCAAIAAAPVPAEEVAPPAATAEDLAADPQVATGSTSPAAVAAAPVLDPPAGVSESSSSNLKDPVLGEAKKSEKEKSKSNACFGIGSVWPCVIGAAALVCLLWLCKDKKQSKTAFVPAPPPPLPGKPGESVNTNSTTTRPSTVR